MAFKRRAGMVWLAAALIFAAARSERAIAETTAAPSTAETSLSALVLPYSPYLFDLAIYGGRNVAQITYGARRYDRVTRSLVVTGLTVVRGGFSARIGQLRLSADRALLDDVAVDTRTMPLDPTTRAVLKRLDREVVTGSITLAGVVDAPSADYDIDAEIEIDGAGTLDVVAGLLGFHILMPVEGETLDRGEPQVAGRLRSARADFTDAGLVEAVYEVVGGRQGLRPEQSKATAVLMAGLGLASIVGKIPGIEMSDLRERSKTWSSAIQAFLKNPDRLTVSLDPAAPVELALLTDGVTAAEVEVLKPTVVSGPAPRITLVDPARLTVGPDGAVEDVLPVAKALIDGVGVPQDLARGVALVMPAATAGNRAAITLLARAVALNPGVAIAQDGLRGAYVALLLVNADGRDVGGAGLDALRGRLSPEEVAAGEDEALARWRRTAVGKVQHAAELTAFEKRDWPAIRRLALGYYEGTTMPRNAMRAYGWSSIAAAGGDRIAAELRNDLIGAVNEGRMVLPMARARQATADLWALIVTDKADKATIAAPAPATDQPPSNETPKEEKGRAEPDADD